MTKEVEFLNYIYQNAKMGTDTLKQIVDISEDRTFRNELKSELEEYENIVKEAIELFEKLEVKEKEISLFDKIETYVTINLKTIKDKSNQNIAEMLIIGSNMGIINSIKNINKYKDCIEKEILTLAEKLLDTEENNIKELKKYL
ncbi:MAG: hypothetical protein ACK5LY_01255 [Lachnospirales bacterium]